MNKAAQALVFNAFRLGVRLGQAQYTTMKTKQYVVFNAFRLGVRLGPVCPAGETVLGYAESSMPFGWESGWDAHMAGEVSR